MNEAECQIRDEFDRIAVVTQEHGGERGEIYFEYLLRQLPQHIDDALDIGCGSGAFTRHLASRSNNVLAIDLSPQMIRWAESQSKAHDNIHYEVADVMQMTLEPARFDCIVSLATLHHLPLEPALLKLKHAVRPGGTLMVHDLVAAKGRWDRSMSALAYPVSAGRRLLKTGRLRAPRAVREAWTSHADGEVYLTMGEVREICDKHLPGAFIKRHLLWRYTVVWRNNIWSAAA